VLEIPTNMSIVSVGDIDRDGNADLLLRDRRLIICSSISLQVRQTNEVGGRGKPTADWSIAGITGLLRGDQQEISFQEKSTRKAFAWTLDANLNIVGVVESAVGNHDGLRVHLSEP
jgi:hypothetical protein